MNYRATRPSTALVCFLLDRISIMVQVQDLLGPLLGHDPKVLSMLRLAKMAKLSHQRLSLVLRCHPKRSQTMVSLT